VRTANGEVLLHTLCWWILIKLATSPLHFHTVYHTNRSITAIGESFLARKEDNKGVDRAGHLAEPPLQHRVHRLRPRDPWRKDPRGERVPVSVWIPHHKHATEEVGYMAEA
jgi:hypothetical protein